jgi:hypothetical protein
MGGKNILPPAVIDIVHQHLDKISIGDSMERFSMSRKVRWRMNEFQQGKPVVVCLCGSTRFGEMFRYVNQRETLAGKIVLAPSCFQGDVVLEVLPGVKRRLDELHLQKIDLADEILVVNVGGYVGESTRREIAYARQQGKRVRWLESGACGDEERE